MSTAHAIRHVQSNNLIGATPIIITNAAIVGITSKMISAGLVIAPRPTATPDKHPISNNAIA